MDWQTHWHALMGSKLPHFFVIGAQKAGTTTVHEWLLQHSDVFLPAVKETHYFTLFHDKPLTWYAEHYALARANQRRGDITPYYAFHPYVPAKIRALLPASRLIFLVRDPVDRAISHYFHEVRRGHEQLPIDEALRSEVDRLAGSVELLQKPGSRVLAHQIFSYVSRSRYELQIQAYLRCFPAKQLLVLRSESLFAAETSSWDSILHHIGVHPSRVHPPVPQANAGRGEAESISTTLRTRLRTELDPTYRWLASEYGIRWD